MKKCSKCGIEKDLSFFGLGSKYKDKKRTQCKDCDYLYRKSLDKEKCSEYRKLYYLENKDKLSVYNKVYRIEKSESIRLSKIKNKDINKIKIRSREYYLKNKDILNEKSKLYQQRNKESLRNKNRLRNTKRRNNEPVFKLKCNIRRLIQLSLKSKGYTKDSKTFEILGCDVIKFKEYLESKFDHWMTWDNKGLYNGSFDYGWDLDHIIPLKTALTKEDVIKLNHYTNFQPLCGKLNREIKNGKY